MGSALECLVPALALAQLTSEIAEEAPMTCTTATDGEGTRSTHRPYEWARSAALIKGSETFHERVSLEAALDAALREFQRELEMRQARDATLVEAVARQLCWVAGLDPDDLYYPVSSHRAISWPMWREFRKAARDIIALVGQAARPPA
jgi:hypothetical protein